MRTTTTVRSWPAIGLGLFLAAVTARVLLDDVAGGAPFTAAHLLSIAALVAALGAGHMAWPALREGAIVPGLLLVVTFLAATAYIVVQSGARNAERAGDKTADIEETNCHRAGVLKLRSDAAYLLAACPAATPQAAHGVSCGLREAMAAECAIDQIEQRHRFAAQRMDHVPVDHVRGKTLRATAFVPEDKALQTEFVNDWMRPQGIGAGATAATVVWRRSSRFASHGRKSTPRFLAFRIAGSAAAQ